MLKIRRMFAKRLRKILTQIRFLRVKKRFNRRYFDSVFGFHLTLEQRLRRYETQKQPWSINDYTHIHYVRPDGTTHCQWYRRGPDNKISAIDI